MAVIRSGSRVTGKLDSRFIYAAYRHDFLKLDQVRLGGTAGASLMSLGASLAASVGLVDSTGTPLGREGEVGEDAKSDAAKKVGAALAQAAKAQGIEAVVFDRNGFDYHGRVEAVAAAAREAGLKF